MGERAPLRWGSFAFWLHLNLSSLLLATLLVSLSFSDLVLDRLEIVLYADCMNYSSDFATTLATIAAKAMSFRGVTPEAAVDFAWFSVNSVGDASIDDHDLARHLAEWRVED